MPIQPRSAVAIAPNLLRVILASSVVLQVLAPAATSYAASVTGASFTGGASTYRDPVSGTLYAKQGASLTLNVTTDATTKCVRVSDGTTTVDQTSSTAKTSWTFPPPASPLFTAGAGDGMKSVTATAFRSFNGQGKCTANAGESFGAQTASYILDNTGPVVTSSLSPARNAAGWNNSNVSITWSATDAGSGVGTGPTPATDSVTLDTAGVTKTATGTDHLGNSGTGSVAVKLDKTPPTISGSRSPAPNANGWNNTAVTVSFTCSDALSGLKSCTGPQTVTTEGTNQAVSGTAADTADNSASTTVSGINIDKTAPSLSGAPTTSPNVAGWYNANVTVSWACSDNLGGSGIDGLCPANSTLSTEGTGQTATASVRDKAGNQTTATSSPAVNIDKTAPTTTASAPPAWNNKSVTVTLSAADNLSGVAATYYTLDGPTQQPYNPATGISITTDGIHALTFWSVDTAGNAEAAQNVLVKIDQTPPTVSHTQSPAANAAGWNNADVTVTFTCADALSGVASCTPPQTVVTEGKNQPVMGTATDNAGNTATDPATLSIDKTKPTISGAADRAANTAGWYNADVVVSFTCSDMLSGIATCPAPQTLLEGANQTASGTATDAAANSASTSVGPLNIDKTPPTLSGAPATPANAAGWYRADVTVAWSCSDALSGIPLGACPANSTITGEGKGLSAGTSVSDNAGNTTTTTVGGISIDRTAPSTLASVPDPLASGWYAGPVLVTLNAVDSLSGVAKTSYSVDGGVAQPYTAPFSHGLPGSHTLTFWSEDQAGNVEDNTAPGHTLTLKIDNIPPTIVGSRTPDANPNGWNNTDVVVSFGCSDAESGIAGCSSPVILSTEGAGQAVSGAATDNAGNTASTTVSAISIDKTAPTLVGLTPPANAAGWYKGDVTVHWAGQDGLSGIDPATQPADSVIIGEGSNLGAGPVTITDKAVNMSAPASISGIKIDRTPPAISGKTINADGTARSANAAGWYNSAVRVRFTCSDALSGVAICPGDTVLDADGTGQNATGTDTDNAGNTASATVSAINIDSRPPQTDINNRCDATTGFCRNGTVTLVVSGSDPPPVGTTGVVTSGVRELRASYTFATSPSDPSLRTYSPEATYPWSGTPITITIPTTNSGTVMVKYYSVDKADNRELPNYVSLNFDNIAPSVTHALTPKANAAGWNNANVDVKFTAVDDDLGSGVDGKTVKCGAPDATGAPTGGTVTTPDGKTFFCDALWGTETAAQIIKGQANDIAGNLGVDSEAIKLDKTLPTITGAATTSSNANGWYNGPVTVKFTCADAGTVQSGIASCTGVSGSVNNGVTLTTNGANQSVTGTALDAADNKATATVAPINIDTEKPTITVNGIASGGVYTLGAVPAASCTATDGFSGIDANGCKLTVTGGKANGVGTFNYGATATDLAGNTATVTGSYSVRYRFDGFLQPINDTGHVTCGATCPLSVFKAGSTVPTKFQLKDAAGNVVQANTAPGWLTPVKGNATTVAVDETTFTDAADVTGTYRWDSTSQQYIFNWGTLKSGAGFYWKIGVDLDDGSRYTVDIGLR